MQVTVFGLDDDAKKCGIDADSLKNTAMLPIRAYTKLQDGFVIGASGWLTIILGVLKAPTFCAVTVTVEASEFVTLKLPHAEVQDSQKIILWTNTHVLTGGPASVGTRTNAAVEQMAKELASHWQKANQ